MKYTIHQGDNIDTLKTYPDNYFDSIATDPPYGLKFMGKKRDHNVPSVELRQEALRVLKPGGHLLSFGGSRTYHRMVVNIEDAGFEIRDQIMRIYGSGFPKSHNVEKAVKKLGVESESYKGIGTALKPAHEPIVVARKPLSEKTIAKNVLKWGTGGINIDGCRVGDVGGTKKTDTDNCTHSLGKYGDGLNGGKVYNINTGRFPANFIHDGSDEATLGLGDKARYFYTPKASKKDRNNGLDGNKTISIKGVVLPSKDNLGDTEQPDLKPLHLLDIERYQEKDTGEFVVEKKKGLDLNTSWYEKNITDQFLSECKSIIKTKTNGTIVSEIWNLLHQSIIKEYTPDVSGEIECGESLVENVEGGVELTTTIKGNLEFLHDANNVVSKLQLKIREKESKNFHSTVKPTKLMQYLVRLITPKGGIVLDPFMGSGSTGKACMKEGFEFVGMELDEEYCKIADARISCNKN